MSDQDLLRMATAFDMGDVGMWWNGGTFRGHVEIQRCAGTRLPKPIMWKVIEGACYALTKDGDWELEPQPSSRDADYYTRARYDTLAEAYAALKRFYLATKTEEGK
jgi:hypothetical protein